MGILSITTSVAGQTGGLIGGVAPRQVSIITTDNLATVTAAGYLNQASIQGYTIYNTDIINMWYGASGNFQSISSPGTFSVFTPSIVNGVLSLVANVNPGDVLLPVVSNHIAIFNGTTGQITGDLSPAINGGNIQAGLSGTAGTLGSFPGTAASGELILAAVNNSSGNFNTTISNAASVGQSQVISIPDGGVAASNAIISNSAGTQTIATGNLAISTGNLVAGSSGHAGTITSFPGTASKGSLIIAGVANTGNTNTTISNDAMAQASVLSIPDPGNAAGQFLVGATATPFVNGNFPENSGTAGLMIDSGVSVASLSSAITQLGGLYQVSVTLLPAQMTTAYATPVNLIAAVSGKVIQIVSASVYTASTGNTAYATGTAPIIQYGTTVHGGGTSAVGAGLVAGDITAATSQMRTLGPIASAALTGDTNVGVYFSNATNNYTSGTGTNVTFNFVYQLVTASI
jgi:hypothetical protein